jgi:hypothetical protein
MGALQNKLSLNGSFSCLTGWREVFLVGGVRIEPPLFLWIKRRFYLKFCNFRNQKIFANFLPSKS